MEDYLYQKDLLLPLGGIAKKGGLVFPHLLYTVDTSLSLQCVIKIGPWSNKIKQMRKQNTEDTQYNETQIYVVHPVWATSTREIARSFLYYYPANEGIQPTTKLIVTSSSFSHSFLY